MPEPVINLLLPLLLIVVVPELIVTVAIPALNVAATPPPTKLIVAAVPTVDPSSFTITPDPDAVTPVSPEPSPLNCVAVIIPVTFTPSEFAVIPVPTSRPFFTLKFSAAPGSISPVVF